MRMLQNADVFVAPGNGALPPIPHDKRDLLHHAPCSVWSKMLHDAPGPLALITPPISSRARGPSTIVAPWGTCLKSRVERLQLLQTPGKPQGRRRCKEAAIADGDVVPRPATARRPTIPYQVPELPQYIWHCPRYQARCDHSCDRKLIKNGTPIGGVMIMTVAIGGVAL